MDKIKELLIKYKEIILYLFFGGLTTLVNIVSYVVCAKLFNLGTVSSVTIAWTIAVVFAYVTNRIWVFHSTASGKLLVREALSFFGCRLLSYFIDVGIMYLFVDILGFNDILIKIISNIVVVIFNYVFSKLIIFKDDKPKGR